MFFVVVLYYLMVLLEWWCNHLKINTYVYVTIWRINVEFVHSFGKPIQTCAPLHIIVYDFLLQLYFYFAIYYVRAHTRYRIKNLKQSHCDLVVDNRKAENLPKHHKQ